MDGVFSKKLKRSISGLVFFALILGTISLLNFIEKPLGTRPVSPVPLPDVSLQPLPTLPANTMGPAATGSAVLGNTTREKALVKRIVDGDTILLADGRKVRYIGIDTPETVKPGVQVECFGHEAAGKNKSLVEGKEIEMEKDVSETDRYGRLLRFVYIGDTFVNDAMVREGYAYASDYPPDIKYSEQFKSAQREAQSRSVGLWKAGCPVHKGDKV